MKKVVRGVAIALLHMGIDVRKIASWIFFPRYIMDCFRFISAGGKISFFFPIMIDYQDQAGSARGHYFHQDLLVASYIAARNPVKHLDIGSRIDGFVAHVASFREIHVMDIRELKDTGHQNIKFVKADLMQTLSGDIYMSDSVSCLHALEHFGLGRYGDPIDKDGHIKGFQNIAKLVNAGGFLYVSFPIGTKPQVQFNAQRIMGATDILGWVGHDTGLELIQFDYVDDAGSLHRNADIHHLEPMKFGCGIYTFQKSAA